jgi:hypothetical protein
MGKQTNQEGGGDREKDNKRGRWRNQLTDKKEETCVWCLHFCHLFSVPFLDFSPIFFFFFPVVPTNFDSFVPLKNCAVKERREKEKKKRPGGTNKKQRSNLMSNMCLVRLSRSCLLFVALSICC